MLQTKRFHATKVGKVLTEQYAHRMLKFPRETMESSMAGKMLSWVRLGFPFYT
jgi:hypothetical protein